jgi:hypothetical protein
MALLTGVLGGGPEMLCPAAHVSPLSGMVTMYLLDERRPRGPIAEADPRERAQGGDHTQLKVRKARSGETRWTLNETTTNIIKELARQVPDLQIASILNRAGKRTGRDNTWTEVRIRAFS